MRKLARHSLEWKENTRTHIRVLDHEDSNQLGPVRRHVKLKLSVTVAQESTASQSVGRLYRFV
jgi:hypothetical protein